MHSKIIQISKAPIDPKNYISPNDYDRDHWFLNLIADYVDTDEDRTATLEWLEERLSEKAPIVLFREENEEGFMLPKGFASAYFTTQYGKFKENLALLNEKVSLETFSNEEFDYTLFLLNLAYRDDYDIYFAITGADEFDRDLVPLDTFVRAAEAGTRWYFGGTVDYHF